MKSTVLYLTITYLMFFSYETNAQIFQCPNENGELVFTDIPCQETNESSNRLFTDKGMLRKYFNKAEKRYYRQPKCNHVKCSCGRIVRLDMLSERQLLKSLRVLPEVYDEYIYEKRRYEALEKARVTRSNGQVILAACRLSIHQHLINKYYSVINDIENEINEFKPKGSPVECENRPILSQDTSNDQFDQSVTKWKKCKQRYKDNFAYRDAINRHENNKLIYKQLTSAVDRLKL